MDAFEKFKTMFNQLPDEFIQEKNKEMIQKVHEERKRLKDSLQNGQCCYCNLSVKHFDENIPCFHWFLYPINFKKKHLPKVFGKYSYHQIDIYSEEGIREPGINDTFEFAYLFVNETARLEYVDIAEILMISATYEWLESWQGYSFLPSDYVDYNPDEFNLDCFSPSVLDLL